MNLAATAVLTDVSAAPATPQLPQLWAELQRGSSSSWCAS
jgi:hypothetical protein